MPCKYEYDKGEKKDMILYYILYNVSLSEQNTLTNWANNLRKDPTLLALKLQMDNAILELRAREKNLDFTPKIELEMQDYPRVTDRML